MNVLITRARKRCEIFTNLLPQDIDTSRTHAKGMMALKRYLKYAQTGELDLPEATGREADSLFEEDVAHELRQHGYEVEHQVGSAGFLIDLGIRHPDNPSEFIIGIECDGASYHSARSARDRDRIRQQVLERIGWNIYRIWSTDWFKNREKEVAKLRQELDWLLLGNDIDNDKYTREKKSGSPEPSFIRISVDKSATESLSQPYQSIDAFDYINFQNFEAEGLVETIVSIEAPIHKELLMKKVAEYLGYGRLGRRVKQRILTAIEYVEDRNKIISKGEFIYNKNSDIVVRDRSMLPTEHRNILYVAPEEIQKTMSSLVNKSFGIDVDELIRETGVLLGFGRITENISSILMDNLNRLLKKGALQMNGSKVFEE